LSPICLMPAQLVSVSDTFGAGATRGPPDTTSLRRAGRCRVGPPPPPESCVSSGSPLEASRAARRMQDECVTSNRRFIGGAQGKGMSMGYTFEHDPKLARAAQMLAEGAVEFAKQQFRTNLDFTESSITRVEWMLSAFHQSAATGIMTEQQSWVLAQL